MRPSWTYRNQHNHVKVKAFPIVSMSNAIHEKDLLGGKYVLIRFDKLIKMQSVRLSEFFMETAFDVQTD